MDSVEQQKASYSRLIAHRETLQKRTLNLEAQQENLTSLYIDPEVHMTRSDFLRQKERIEVEFRSLLQDIERIDAELANIPVSVDLETLETFTDAIRERLAGDYDPSPENKRQILELLHIRVWIGLDGSVRVSGWFGQNVEDRERLLDTTC